MCIFLKGDSVMKKYLTFLSLAVIFVSFSAQAFVMQSAKDALSYKIVHSPQSKPTIRKITPKKTTAKVKKSSGSVAGNGENDLAVSEIKKIDISNNFSKNVFLAEGQEFIITVFEKKGTTWKTSYNTANVSMIDNKISNNKRTFTFRQKTSHDSTIFFDCIDDEGDTIENKAVYIKVN